MLCDALARHGGSVERFFASFEGAPKVRGADFHALMLIAMAASYAPDPNAPLGVALPVDLHTAEVDEERWAQWMAHDPLKIVQNPAAQASLKALQGLFIDCGRRDQYHLHYGARRLSAQLNTAGVEHTYQEFDDNHSSIDYRLDTSLPFLHRALKPGAI